MDWTIVLDSKRHKLTQEGTRAESRLMYVPPGKIGLVSMYNMVEELVLTGEGAQRALSSTACARFLKVSVADSADLPAFKNCAHYIDLHREHERLLGDREIRKEPIYQCGQEWSISPCNNMALIPVPGIYIIELFDVNQLDEAYIEFITLDVAAASIIPDAFKLGAQL